MLQDDYILRQIREMVRAVMKMLFQVDVPELTPEILEDEETKETLESLLALMEEGKIDEAENRLSELLEDGGGEELALALLFYSHLNEKSNDFLEAHDFSREEIKAGLEDALQSQGLSEMAEAFLSEL